MNVRKIMYVCVFTTVHVCFDSELAGGSSFSMCVIHDIINFQIYFDVTEGKEEVDAFKEMKKKFSMRRLKKR